MNEEQKRELNRRADRLSSILQTQGWTEMEAEIARKIERLKKEAGTLALNPDGADQRKLDKIRGQITALHWFIGVPGHAQATLERFLAEVEEDERERIGVG